MFSSSNMSAADDGAADSLVSFCPNLEGIVDEQALIGCCTGPAGLMVQGWIGSGRTWRDGSCRRDRAARGRARD